MTDAEKAALQPQGTALWVALERSVLNRHTVMKRVIKPLYGQRDGTEDPEEYLEDIEYAVQARA
jgi:hypothetical protein